MATLKTLTQAVPTASEIFAYLPMLLLRILASAWLRKVPSPMSSPSTIPRTDLHAPRNGPPAVLHVEKTGVSPLATSKFIVEYMAAQNAYTHSRKPHGKENAKTLASA